jgi:hypothetical protein
MGPTDAAGSVTVRRTGIDVHLPQPELHGFLGAVLAEIAEQRTPRFFKDRDGAFPITRIEADALGRIVQVHRLTGIVTYWLDRTGRLLQIEEPRDRLRVVTRIDEWTRTTPGRALPTRTTTSVFDRETGALLRTEAVVDAHCRLDHVWLPATRWLTVSGIAGSRTIGVEFHDHVLL